MDDNFEKWMQQWAAASEEIAKETPNVAPSQPEPNRASYFTGTPAEYDFVDNTEDGSGGDDWLNIYQRAMEIDYSQGDNLITDAANVAYMGDEGYGKQIVQGTSSSGGKKVFTQNPIHFASVGNDQENEDGRVRVTNNWNDGKELQELDDIKKQVEAMERKVHESDILSKKAERSKFQSQLENLRTRVKQLSEKLTSDPQDDLT
jgi:hypothetical protein